MKFLSRKSKFIMTNLSFTVAVHVNLTKHKKWHFPKQFLTNDSRSFRRRTKHVSIALQPWITTTHLISISEPCRACAFERLWLKVALQILAQNQQLVPVTVIFRLDPRRNPRCPEYCMVIGSFLPMHVNISTAIFIDSLSLDM